MSESVARDNTKLQKIHQFLSQEPIKISIKPKATPVAPENDPVPMASESDTIPTQHMPSEERILYTELRKTISDFYLLTPPDSDEKAHQISCKVVSKERPERKLVVEPIEEVETIDLDDVPAAVGATVSTTIDGIRRLMQAELEHKTAAAQRRSNLSRLKFKAGINPSKNSAAQNELDAEITKESFSQMDIVGQFNLGFIVVRLDADLFIIDQHASDEKYNFETLQKSTVLVSQTCVHPQPLQLSAVNEQILIDNLRIFEQNGFKFQIDEEAEPNKRVKLTAKPMSGSYCFGKEDIDELIFMLQDAPPSTTDTRYRPSKVRDLLASRACRKSVMFGDALTGAQMKALVGRMGTIDHPWVSENTVLGLF
jgi:DNA mismatch repair ATPase MutL